METKWKYLYEKFWRVNNELGRLTYNTVETIIKQLGGRIVLDDNKNKELRTIYDECFCAVPFVDEEEISIWFGNSSLKSLFIDEDVLYYELCDGRKCDFKYLPPYFSSPICDGLIRWCEIPNTQTQLG